MAMAMFARALSLRRANQRAKAVRRAAAGRSAMEYGTETSPEQSAIHSSRVSQSIDALYVLSYLRDGLSLVDTFASDEHSTCIPSSYCRLTDEKLVLSSLSLSKHARSSDAWDRFSSSLSSSGSDSVESSSEKDAAWGRNSCSLSTEKIEDFCLVFNTEPLLSSPSPPAAAASDCCSFLISRKSNYSKDDLHGLAKRDEGVEAANNTVTVQRRDKLGKDNCMQGVGLSADSRCKLKEGEKQVDDDLRSFLREGAMEAVEKQSCNPYQDFRESMLQMMISACCSSHCKTEIAADHEQITASRSSAVSFSVDEMNIEDLLYCYLRLNSMELHELITQAFSDTCSDFLSLKIC